MEDAVIMPNNKVEDKAKDIVNNLDPDKRNYKLEISEKQASIIQRALELFSRVHIGQLQYVLEQFRQHWIKPKKDCDFEECEKLMSLLKMHLTGFKMNESYGIHSLEVDDDARIAWDLQQVIRHRVSWDREDNPKNRNWKTMMGVNFDEPMKSSSSECLSKIERVN